MTERRKAPGDTNRRRARPSSDRSRTPWYTAPNACRARCFPAASSPLPFAIDTLAHGAALAVRIAASPINEFLVLGLEQLSTSLHRDRDRVRALDREHTRKHGSRVLTGRAQEVLLRHAMVRSDTSRPFSPSLPSSRRAPSSSHVAAASGCLEVCRRRVSLAANAAAMTRSPGDSDLRAAACPCACSRRPAGGALHHLHERLRNELRTPHLEHTGPANYSPMGATRAPSPLRQRFRTRYEIGSRRQSSIERSTVRRSDDGHAAPACPSHTPR